MHAQWLRRLLPFCSMSVGLAAVFWCVIAMNQPASPPDVKKTPKVVKFAVKQKKPPQKRKPKKAKRKRAVSRNAPPAPMLQSSLAGPSFDLPQLDVGDVTGGLREALSKSAKAQVFTADTVDKPPKVAHQVAPEIPAIARRKAITGFVKVRYLINEEGQVERPRVVDSKPKGVFDGGVLAALGQWTYEPAGYQGQSVRVSVVKTFRFN